MSAAEVKDRAEGELKFEASIEVEHDIRDLSAAEVRDEATDEATDDGYNTDLLQRLINDDMDLQPQLYTGSLLLSWLESRDALEINLRNGAHFTVTHPPWRSILQSNISQVLRYPPDNALGTALLSIVGRTPSHDDALSVFPTSTLLCTIPIFASALDLVYQHLPDHIFPDPEDRTALYSLDVIAALVCRLASHPICAYLDLGMTAEHYRGVVVARLRAVNGMHNPEVNGALGAAGLLPSEYAPASVSAEGRSEQGTGDVKTEEDD